MLCAADSLTLRSMHPTPPPPPPMQPPPPPILDSSETHTATAKGREARRSSATLDSPATAAQFLNFGDSPRRFSAAVLSGAALVQSVRACMDRFGFNQLDVMRDSGVSNSVLCLWLQRKYKGDNRKVAMRLQNWMMSVQRREERRQALAAGGGVTEAALAAVPGGTLAAASSATPRAVPLYAYAPVSSYGHGMSSKHSQHVLHEHLVPIRLHHTLPDRLAAAAAAASNGSSSSSSAAAAASTHPHSESASTYSDCFLWNLFEQQLSPRAFLSQTLADEGMDVSLWLPPLLAQMQAQLAHFVASEPQRRENLEEWPQLMQQYGVTPQTAPTAAATIQAAAASSVCRSPPAAAAAAASSSSPSPAAAAPLPDLLDDRPPSAVVAAVRGGSSDRTSMLPTFVCGAVSSVPALAARDPANNYHAERNRRAAATHARTAGASNSNGAAAMMDTAGESSSSSAAAASSASPSVARVSPDVSLLHQDPAGILSRQPTPQLVKLKFDLTHNGTHLLYHVLWDPSNPHCIPEDFARIVCKELGLSGDFAALMAWSAREQLERDQRLQALQPGRVEGCLPRVPFPPPGEALFRAEAAARDFGPIVRSVPATTTIKSEPLQQQQPQQQPQQQQNAAAVRMDVFEPLSVVAPLPSPISLASNGLGGGDTPASLSGLKRKSAGADFAPVPSADPMRDEYAASSPNGSDIDLGGAVSLQKKQRQHEVHAAVQTLLERSGVLDDAVPSAAAAAPATSSASSGLPMTPLSGHGSSGNATRFGLSLFSPGGLSAAAAAASASSPSPMVWPPLSAQSSVSPSPSSFAPVLQQPLPPSFSPPFAGSNNTPSPSPRLP